MTDKTRSPVKQSRLNLTVCQKEPMLVSLLALQFTGEGQIKLNVLSADLIVL